ncbi:MAG: PQQ-binding-like beta-propeller repeat protein, partial [Gammaproteobacteria bacterium]|nr:PQQ-binding-like beta-propeller repeat protein [Gammaproteobacteria bacterium]
LVNRWRFDCNPPHYQRYPNGKPIYYYQGDLRVYRNKLKAGEPVEAFNSGDGNFVGPSEILASPVFYEGRVYVATGRDPLHGLGRGALSCIDASGAGDISASGLVWRFEGIGRTMSTVAIADGLVYAADLAGRVYCLDAKTGARYWEHDAGHEIWGNPLVADGKVYVNTKHSFWVLAAGREKRVVSTSRGGSECGPIAANGVVYAVIRGKLYALALEEGTQRT